MAHHGPSDVSRQAADFISQLEGQLGPTGQFPQGKVVERDEGEIKIGVTHGNGKVVLAFGKEIAWIGFTAEQAVEIAATLRDHARAVLAERGERGE